MFTVTPARGKMSGSVIKVWQHQSRETGPPLKLKMVYYTLFCVALGHLFNLSELTLRSCQDDHTQPKDGW